MLSIDGRRIAQGRDFNPDTGERSANAIRDNILQLNGSGAKAVEANIVGKKVDVTTVTKKPFTRRPSAPFTS